ncbi:TPA: RadC family protein [Burkholderia cenocepacia]|uniref:RadC family protein n=1 Tax=Burkholderia cenocepacia TaxID=95486 RepID=UPI002AB62E43|nr:DNA repair protein RadC [Burkholderia cenocepacia]
MSRILADASRKALHQISAQQEDWIIQHAIILLEQRVFSSGPCLANPSDVHDYLRLKLATEPNEVFVAIFMDSQHQVIAYEPLFHGTIDAAVVYPRVLVQRALAHNAAALILAHQHPSGVAKPSAADKAITRDIKAALAMVDVRVLDHIIVGKGTPYSFSEAGLL